MLLPDAPSDIYAAIGKNGQYLVVIPSENTVIVRMGNSPDTNPVSVIFLREMLDLYQNLSCSTSVDDPVIKVENYHVYPRLASDFIYINNIATSQLISIYDRQGNLVMNSNYESGINIQSLTTGVYFTRMQIDGKIHTDRFVKR